MVKAFTHYQILKTFPSTQYRSGGRSDARSDARSSLTLRYR
ncbi:hypothetical protein [uncultured Nostoc sp.]